MIGRVDKAGNGRAHGRLCILRAEYRESQEYCALCGGSLRRVIARIERICGVVVAFEDGLVRSRSEVVSCIVIAASREHDKGRRWQNQAAASKVYRSGMRKS